MVGSKLIVEHFHCELESGTHAGLGLDSDATPETLADLVTNSESYAVDLRIPFSISEVISAVENFKHVSLFFFCHSKAMIFDTNPEKELWVTPWLAEHVRGDFNLSTSLKLQSVG